MFIKLFIKCQTYYSRPKVGLLLVFNKVNKAFGSYISMYTMDGAVSLHHKFTFIPFQKSITVWSHFHHVGVCESMKQHV